MWWAVRRGLTYKVLLDTTQLYPLIPPIPPYTLPTQSAIPWPHNCCSSFSCSIHEKSRCIHPLQVKYCFHINSFKQTGEIIGIPGPISSISKTFTGHVLASSSARSPSMSSSKTTWWASNNIQENMRISFKTRTHKPSPHSCKTEQMQHPTSGSILYLAVATGDHLACVLPIPFTACASSSIACP